MSIIKQFEDAYWSSFPPAVRALRPMLADLTNDKISLEAVQEKAFELAVAGYTVDPLVMRYGMDPYFVTVSRKDQGYAWVPAFMEEKNYDAGPGVTHPAPGWRPYDPANPTPRHIKVSLDLADWPPFDKPVAQEPTLPVIAQPNFLAVLTPSKRGALPGENSPDGTVFDGPQGKWIKKVLTGPFGNWVWWEEVTK